MFFFKKLLILYFFSIISFSSSFAEAPFSVDKVIRGKPISSKNSPYVQVKECNSKNCSRSTGTLISNKHVIMPAGIVLYPNQPELYHVIINDITYEVESVNIPDSFYERENCSPSNIAILTLKDIVPSSVKPLPLTKNRKDYKKGTTVSFSGYGCNITSCDKDKTSELCKNCWGTLRKGSSKIAGFINKKKSALLVKNGRFSFVFREGGPAATVSAKRKVIKKVKTKFGVRRVARIIKKQAIIGLYSCYRYHGDDDQASRDTQGEIPLMWESGIAKFIKKATNNKAKFI